MVNQIWNKLLKNTIENHKKKFRLILFALFVFIFQFLLFSNIYGSASEISISPNTLDVSMEPGWIDVNVSISNDGSSNISWEVISHDYLFQDDFEDGDYESWSNESGLYTREISNHSSSETNNFSLSLDGGDNNYCDGIVHNLSALTPTDVSFQIRSNSTSRNDAYFVLGDNATSTISTSAIYFYVSCNS